MATFKRTLYEYDQLTSAGALKVKHRVEFSEGKAKNKFKAAVQSGGEIALKYSAFYPDPESAGGHVFMLGWDHAMSIEKRQGAYYAVAIFASGDNDANADVCVFDARKGRGEKMAPSSIETMPAHGKKGETRWRRYDLRALNLRVSRLVTFSITSCSFACMWPLHEDRLFVSHMAFSAPIPLFWMLRSGVERSAPTNVQMLASLNQTNEELDKFTVENLCLASQCNVDARYLLRGPYLCKDFGVLAPFKTHPYVSLSFGHGAIEYSGALGFNNDPEMPVEMPPFHSTIGNALHAFQSCSDAAKILAEEVDLLSGKYGFESLHRLMLDLIARADAQQVENDRQKSFWQSSERYRSANVSRLEAQVEQQHLEISPLLKDRVRAVFLLAELTKNPKDPRYKLAFDAVMAAWRTEQMGFSMPLHEFHSPGQPDQKVVFQEERDVHPLQFILSRAVDKMKANKVFAAQQRAFEAESSSDWED